jgi:hypothetical protein
MDNTREQHRLQYSDLSNEDIDETDRGLIRQFLEDLTNQPIYYFDISSLKVTYDPVVFGCCEVLLSKTYRIHTDYRLEDYEIYIVHIEDIFIILRQYVNDNIDEVVNNAELYNLYSFYRPYIEDYEHTVTPNIIQEECPICYQCPTDIVTFECSHTVCIECKTSLLKNHIKQCPICRVSIVSDDITNSVDFYDYLKSADYNEPDFLDMININDLVDYLIDQDHIDLYQCYDLEMLLIETSTYELMISNEF